jgi:translation initiation factor IF-3
VRLIGPDGGQVGIVPTREALDLAKRHELDLVLVTATANPPVCRIVDYGRYKYELARREREHKKKQQDVKGIKISPRIAEHDMAFLMRNAIRFLEEGHKVRITCQFRAREVTHPELGRMKLDRMAEEAAHLAVVERPPTLDGKMMTMVLVPKPRPSGKGHGKTENQQDGLQAVQGDRVGQDHASQGV